MSGETVTVIGLGKMGLPAAVFYASRGASVIGVDIDAGTVAAVNAGFTTIGEEPGVDEHLAGVVHSGALVATGSLEEAVARSTVAIVLVPLTAHDAKPDLATLDRLVDDLGTLVTNEHLVIFETTLPVGTTRERFAPALRSESKPCVAFSPERVSSGRIFEDLDTYPKLVGGVDSDSTRRAVAFYERYLTAEVRPMASADTAEMAKLAETTYRDLNIAFANELAKMCADRGLAVDEVISAANSQPYSHIHTPGVGVGGHCIPHYPHLLQGSTAGSDLVEVARRINDEMPIWVVDRIEEALGSLDGSTVVALGLAYRPGVPETASSPTFALDRELRERGATLLVEDPLFDQDAIRSEGLQAWNGEVPDAVVLVTAHDSYGELDLGRYPPLLVVDGRNALDRNQIEALGHRYLGIGR